MEYMIKTYLYIAVLILAILIITGCNRSPTQLTNDSNREYKERNYKAALKDEADAIKEAAAQGGPIQEYKLALAYQSGDYEPYIKESTELAFEGFNKAAQKGNVDAEVILGRIYELGYVYEVPSPNYSNSIKWYMKAAQQGNALAQFSLGEMYDEGLGIPQNYSDAIDWYTQSAQQGHIDAEVVLADIYFDGKEAEQNYAEAAKWYAMAAQAGDAHAQYMLGRMYEQGRLVPQDFAKTVGLFVQAASLSDENCDPHGWCPPPSRDIDCGTLDACQLEGYMPGIFLHTSMEKKIGNEDVRDGMSAAGLLDEFYMGNQIPKDYDAEFPRFYKKAAQGDARSQLLLGIYYENGWGTSRNYVKAYEWFARAKMNKSKGDKVSIHAGLYIPVPGFSGATLNESEDSTITTYSDLYLTDLELHYMTRQQIALAQQQVMESYQHSHVDNVPAPPNSSGTQANRIPEHTATPALLSSAGPPSALSPADLRILRLVLAANGTLTKEMHDEFWASFKGQPQSQVIPAMNALTNSLQMFQEYQIEIWKCAQTSYETRHVYKSQRLLTLQRELPARLAQTTTWNPNDQEYKDFLAGFQSGYKQSLSDTDRLLNAAATHQPIVMPNGSTVQVNEALIQQVLAGIKGSIERLQELLNPNWNGS